MQRMSEFMECRHDLIPGEQRRFAGRRLGNVQVVRHHRLVAGECRLRDIRIHPRAATLGSARIDVGNEDGQLLPGSIEHVIDADVGLVHRQIGAALEAQAVQLAGREEHSLLQHIVQLEVGLELGLIEGILLGAHFFAVIGPVPGRELETTVVVVDARLQQCCLAPGIGHGWGRQLSQHAIYGLR